jgi:hypothetical protein
VDLLLEEEGGVVAGGHPLMVLRCLEGGGFPNRAPLLLWSSRSSRRRRGWRGDREDMEEEMEKQREEEREQSGGDGDVEGEGDGE